MQSKLVSTQQSINRIIAGDLDDKATTRALLRAAETLTDLARVDTTTAGLTPADGLFVKAADIPVVPQVGMFRTDGTGILYGGALTWLSAPPGSGKSLTATASALEMARSGMRVGFLDFESTAMVFTRRLAQLGAAPGDDAEANLSYFEMTGVALGDLSSARATLAATVTALNLDVIVLDGFAVMLAMLGMDENSNSDVSAVGAMLIDLVKDSDRAILIIDHLAKESQNQSAKSKTMARGASAKQALPALALIVHVAVAPAVGRPGLLHFVVSKDRYGLIGVPGDKATSVRFTPAERADIDGGLDVTFDDPEGGSGQPIWLAGIAGQIMRLLNQSPTKSLTTSELKAQMRQGTWRKYGQQYLDDLEHYGHIAAKSGPGRTVTYSWVKPLTDEDVEYITTDKLNLALGNDESPF
jgi:KaiC/GvpD/RAD55 family RecA-like ATPase